MGTRIHMDTHYSERLSARESNEPSGSLLERWGNSMAKVVRFHEFGAPEVLRLEEITIGGRHTDLYDSQPNQGYRTEGARRRTCHRYRRARYPDGGRA